MKLDYAITNKDVNQPVNLKGDKDIRLKSDFRSKIETKFNMFYAKSENGIVEEFTVSPKLFIKWHKEVMFKRQKNGWFTGTTDINNHDDTILFTQMAKCC